MNPSSDSVVPGTKLRRFCSAYNFAEHLRRRGDGSNMLRSATYAQPRTLCVGDVLATGDMVLSEPREARNGGVWLHLTGGLSGHWVRVAARFPIALATETELELIAETEELKRNAIKFKEWEPVEFLGVRPVCSKCGCASVRRDPADTLHWGCASCGFNASAVKTHFDQYLQCVDCGQRVPGGKNQPEECPGCHKTFEQVPPFRAMP